MTANPWEAQGRERKALAIEHALRAAGVDTHAQLAALVLSDPAIRERAERAAADQLGHAWRRPASAATWQRVTDLYLDTDRSRALIGAHRD